MLGGLLVPVFTMVGDGRPRGRTSRRGRLDSRQRGLYDDDGRVRPDAYLAAEGVDRAVVLSEYSPSPTAAGAGGTTWLRTYYAKHNWARLTRRMIFATDWPGIPGIAANARAVAALCPDEETTGLVLAGNACAVYHFETHSRPSTP